MLTTNLPLISVIVPCYNDGKYIMDCLNSVHNQNYKNYEIIIVNDGSTDIKTNRLLNSINHPKIKIFQTPNQGPAKARNFAIENSSGKYIFPLDADNKVSQEFIEEAIGILEANNDIKIVSSDLRIFGLSRGILTFVPYSMEILLCRNIIENASVYRKEDFNKTIGYNPNMKGGYEDWDFWLSLLEFGGEVYQIHKPHIFYRIKKTSRNQSLWEEEQRRLRRQIYLNHKELYSKFFIDPVECYEYRTVVNSKEYRFGKFFLIPIRRFYRQFISLFVK